MSRHIPLSPVGPDCMAQLIVTIFVAAKAKTVWLKSRFNVQQNWTQEIMDHDTEAHICSLRRSKTVVSRVIIWIVLGKIPNDSVHYIFTTPANSAARRSWSGTHSSIKCSGVIHLPVKLRWAFLNANLSICKDSIKMGFIWLHFFVSISALDEKMHSDGTAEAWIGR